MYQNYANANAFFSVAKNSEVSRVYNLKAGVQPVLKMWWFLMVSFFEPELLMFKVRSKLKKKFL